MKNLILINLKDYVYGKEAIKLCQKIAKVESKFEIAVAPPLLDLEEAGKIKISVYAQHADPVLNGAHTGSISLEELKQLGIKGAILNHSERKLPFRTIRETIFLCRKKKLITVTCASTLSEVKKLAALQPDYIAYEPAALIGGETSVTTAQPKVLVDVVKAVEKINPKTQVLCGAGIHAAEDVKVALKSGMKGILISHAVIKAKDPQRFIEELIT